MHAYVYMYAYGCVYKCCIDSVSETVNITSLDKPPNYFGGSVQTIDLQRPRESNYSDLSLKCNIAETKLKYRSSFFFRATQEWNRLPSDVLLIENSNQFRDNLLAYINIQAFSSEIEPD